MRFWPRKQVYVDDLPRTHDIRFAALFILLFVASLALLYAVGFFVAGDRLPRGTSVAGIDVGGMRRGEARSELQDKLLPRLEQPITVHALDETFEIDPQVAGMTFNLEATLSVGLAGERWDPRHMLKVVLGGGPLTTMIDVDNEELDAALQKIADKIERPPVEGSVSFEHAKPVATPGDVGVALDFSGSADVLREALLEGDDEVELPTNTVEPEVTTTEATDFVVDVGEPAVASPVRVRVADVVRSVPPRVFAPAMVVEVSDGELRLAVDVRSLAERSRSILAGLPHHPVNARVTFRNGQPVVVPGRNGARVEPEDWAAAVLQAAKRSGGARTASATVTPDPPDLTTEQARRLEVHERIIRAQIRVPAQFVPDVAAVTSRLDGALLGPDATFSFLRRVGAVNPDASSIVASAAYDAAFRSGMGSIERTAPRVHIAGAGPGLDASVAVGTDLSWRNGTPYGVYIRAVASAPRRGAGQVTVEFWSTSYWKISLDDSGRYNVSEPKVLRQTGPGCQDRPGSTGYEIDVSRTFSGAGSGQRVETVHSEYATVDAIVCGRGSRP